MFIAFSAISYASSIWNFWSTTRLVKFTNENNFRSVFLFSKVNSIIDFM